MYMGLKYWNISEFDIRMLCYHSKYKFETTIPHKNIETNDKFYRKVAFLMYTEMVTLRGLNFAGIKFRGSLHPRNFDTFAGI